jgi:hypothetical protein
MELTKDEQKLLKRMEKIENTRFARYIAVGGGLGAALFSIIFGYVFKDKSGYVVGFYIGTISLLLLVASRTEDRLYEIIKKLQGKQ